MVDNERAHVRFGCEHCWPASPDAAWEARRAHACDADLIDESHYHVMILVCSRCTQRFASIFTETIDWADGEDPQSWALVPITAAEASRLVGHRDIVSEAHLNELGVERQFLRHDNPKAATPRTFWATGICVGPHD